MTYEALATQGLYWRDAAPPASASALICPAAPSPHRGTPEGIYFWSSLPTRGGGVRWPSATGGTPVGLLRGQLFVPPPFLRCELGGCSRHGRMTRPGEAGNTGCDICESHDGIGPLVVPVVWEDETIVVKHLFDPMPVFLGHLVVETRRHAVRIEGITDDEAAATGRAVRRAALALRAVFDVDYVHAAIINTGLEHFHEHVYLRHRGTPSDYRWLDADAWPGAPHGDADAVVQSCSRRLCCLAGLGLLRLNG